MDKKELIKLISELPQEFLPTMLTLFPLKRELEKANASLHFIKNYEKTYPSEKKEAFIFSELVNIAHTQNLGSKIISDSLDSEDIQKILNDLPIDYLWTSLIAFISNTSLQKKHKNYLKTQKEIKEAISKSSFNLSSPIFSESLYFLALQKSWKERLQLIKDQIAAFSTELENIKKLNPLQRFLRTSELLKLIKKDKEAYISIQQGSFWEKIWNWMTSLFQKDKKCVLLTAEIKELDSTLEKELGTSILELFSKKPEMSMVPLIKEYLLPIKFDSKMLFYLLEKYQPSVMDLKDPHRVRKIIQMLCEVCDVNAYEHEIMTQYFLYQKNQESSSWHEFTKIFRNTDLESIDFFHQYLIQLMTLDTEKISNFCIDTPYPILNKSLTSIDKFSNYLKIMHSFGVSIPLSSLENAPLFQDPMNLKKLIEMKEFFEIFDADCQQPLFEKIVKELAINPTILTNDYIQSFYQRLPSDLKIYFIEQTINQVDQDQLSVFDHSLNVQEISQETWKHFIDAQDLSLSMIEYLIQKISSQESISENNFQILHQLTQKFIEKISIINCSDVFTNYTFHLLMPYFMGKFSAGASFSLEKNLYTAFEKTTNSSTTSLIVGLMGFEFGSYSVLPSSAQFRLFKAFQELSDNILVSENVYSTIIGLFSTQSEFIKEKIRIHLNTVFEKTACEKPDVFLEKEKSIFILCKALDIEHCLIDQPDRVLCAQLLCRMNETKTINEAISLIRNWPTAQFNLISKKLKESFQKQFSKKLNAEPWNHLPGNALLNDPHRGLSKIELLQNLFINPQCHLEQLLQKDFLYNDESFLNIKAEAFDLIYKDLNEELSMQLAQKLIQDFEKELPAIEFIDFALNFLEKKLIDSKYHWSEHLEELAIRYCALKSNEPEQHRKALHLLSHLETRKSSGIINRLNPFKHQSLKKLDILSKLEVECLQKVQQTLASSVDESLFEQAKVLIQGTIISTDEIEALSIQINHPLKLKMAQYIILIELINFNLNKTQSSENQLRSLRFLIEHGESSGIRRRAQLVLDYLCRGRGSNSHSLGEPDFESGASAYSATSASANNHKFFWSKKQ